MSDEMIPYVRDWFPLWENSRLDRDEEEAEKSAMWSLIHTQFQTEKKFQKHHSPWLLDQLFSSSVKNDLSNDKKMFSQMTRESSRYFRGKTELPVSICLLILGALLMELSNNELFASIVLSIGVIGVILSWAKKGDHEYAEFKVEQLQRKWGELVSNDNKLPDIGTKK